MIAERPHRKVLVVDDEPLVRETLDYCLNDEYDITAAASGEEAIELAKQDDFRWCCSTCGWTASRAWKP